MDDGTLDEILLLDLLGLFRALSERIEVAIVDHLDRFDDITLNRWQPGNIFASLATIDTTEKVMVINAGTDARPIVPRFATVASITQPSTSLKFKLMTSASDIVITICDAMDALNYISVLINQTNIIVSQTVAGVGTTLSTFPHVGSAVPVVPGAYYALRIETLTVSGGTRVRVFIDSSQLIEVVSTRTAAGTIQLTSVHGSARVDNFEMHSGPLRFATLGPAGVTASANFYQ